jgi:CheY-like chemotaxis protein
MHPASKETPSSPSEVAVLVVADDSDIHSSLADFFRLLGYTVFEAPDGMSALERLHAHPLPLIVWLDWMMPGMDGVQVLQAPAGDAAVVQPHVFSMLTAADTDARQRLTHDLAAIPAHQFVTGLDKPFDLDDLAAFVARASAHMAVDPQG